MGGHLLHARDAAMILCIGLFASAPLDAQGVPGATTKAQAAPRDPWVRKEGKPGLIVFVHGFMGDSRSTWTNEETHSYWPQLLSSDHDFDKFDIYAYEYSSSLTRKEATITDLVHQTEGVFLYDKIFDYQKVVFVCHSMGGIVIRDLLKYRALSPQRSDIQRVGMIYFFGTPTDGSEYADILSRVPGLNRGQILALRSLDDNEFLDDLRSLWQHSPELQKIPSYCGYETTSVAFRKVVRQSSASALCPEHVTPITGDHFQIVKPKDRRADSYMAVANAVRQLAWDSQSPAAGRSNAAKKLDATPTPVVQKKPPSPPRTGIEASVLLPALARVEVGDLRGAGELLGVPPSGIAPEWAAFAEMVVRFERGNYEDILDPAFATAIKESPSNARIGRAAQYLLAAALQRERRDEEALPFADAAIEKGIRNFEVYYIRGEARARIAEDKQADSGRTDEFQRLLNGAIDDLEEAHRLSPGDARAVAWSAFAYNLRKDRLSAAQAAADAVKLYGDCGREYAYSDCASALNNLGYDKLVEAENRGGTAGEMRAAATAAEPLLERAVLLDPSHGRNWVNLAWAENELGKYSDALDHSIRGGRLMAGDRYLYAAWQERATALQGLGRPEEAQQAKAESDRLRPASLR